jgi:DnaA-homolog protein
MMNNVQQILPGFTARSDAFFSSFYTPPALLLVKTSLMECVQKNSPAFIYLCGMDGTGKSHLLQAVCNLADEQKKTAMYLPLRELLAYNPKDILDNTAMIDVLCIDDIDCIVGNTSWEEALFHLYNQRMAAEKATLFAAQLTARELTLQLPDLQTRLAACLSFQLPVLDDEEKVALIQFRANHTGMEINDACSQFIIQRSGRHLADLMTVLDRLDKESLIAGRKITVPFIKSVFHW